MHLEKLQTNGILCFVFSNIWKLQQNPKPHLSFDQSLKTIMDAIDLVTVNERQSHRRPYRRVHPCSWSSHVQNGQGEISLEGSTGPTSTIEMKLCWGGSVPERESSPHS